MKNYRTYQIAKEFYHLAENIECPPHLRDQALRAASSVVLNTFEGADLPSKRLKAKHYNIALGILREVQGALVCLSEKRRIGHRLSQNTCHHCTMK